MEEAGLRRAETLLLRATAEERAIVASPSVVDEVWARQSVWSQAANRMTTSIHRARTTILIFTVIGAALATVAAAVGSSNQRAGSVLAVASAVSVGLVPVLRPRATGTALQQWTRARSVAEALKSEVYLYLARSGRYAGSDRQTQLADTTDEVMRDAADLLPHTVGITPAQRDLPLVTDVVSYFPVRVESQIDGFYRPRARALQRRLTRFRRLEALLSLAGVVLAALAATFPRAGVGSWVAVVTTVTAAVATHVAAGRYDYQLVEYLRTANELSRIRRDADRSRSADDLDELVQRAERIISIQNEGWMAKLSSSPETEATSA
jgi:hypothetical protein